MNELSRTLVFLGVILIVIGLAASVFEKVPGLGRLPGDITIRKGNFSFYFPLATCLLASLILTVLFSLFGRR